MASAGCDGRRRRSRCRRPVSWPRRSDPTGSAHATPGTSRSRSSSGSATAVARPSGMRGIDARSVGSAAPIAASTCGVEAGDRADRSLADGGGEVRGRGRTERSMDRGELVDRDGARLEQPPQIGRQVGERRLDEHPAARLVHLAQPLEDRRGRCRRADRRAADRGRRRSRSRRARTSARGAREHRLFDAIAADRRQRRELVERAMKGRGGSRAGIARNRRASLSVRRVQAVACLGASLVSVGSFAASHSAMPPLSATAR